MPIWRDRVLYFFQMKSFDGDSEKAIPAGGGWRSAIFVIFVEMAERFAYYGVSGNLMMYFTKEMHQPTAVAAKNVNGWFGVLSFALLLGAFVADSYLGRFRATIVSTSIFLLGLSLLTVSVSAIPRDDEHHRHLQSSIFFVGLYTVAIGDGGHRPALQTFAADQFDESSPEEKKAKSSFFNWWYLGIVMGAMTSTVVVIYVQDNVGWGVGFAIPTVVEALAMIVFLLGIGTYRRHRPVESPYTRVAQVVSAAARKWRLKESDHNKISTSNGMVVVVVEDGGGDVGGVNGLEDSKGRIWYRTKQLRFLDKAMIIDGIDASSKTRNPWRLCTLNQVEEVKLILRLFPIWVCSLGYAVIVAQVHTFFIKQAYTMDRSLGKITIPPSSLQIIPGIAILVSVPIYDKIFVPCFRRLTGVPSGISPVARIGAGLALSTVTIAVAAVVEAKRLRRHHEYDDHQLPLSVWWLVPQFAVMGVSDLFAYVGMQELFYVEMPEDMRSMGSAFTNAAIGVGALMSSVVISAVQGISSRFGEEWLVNDLNRAHLDDFYWVLAGLCGVVLGAYVVVGRWFLSLQIRN